MFPQTGELSIQFKKNNKGNLQCKKITITSKDNSAYKFDHIPDKKLPEEQISIALLEKIKSVTEPGKQTWEVEFEAEGQYIFQLREKGQNWDREEVQEIPIPKRDRPQEKPKNLQDTNHFHNPYNFVPALPRNDLPKFDPKTPKRELGDAPPIGHGRYEENYWSGRIKINLTTVTPLLIPDTGEVENLLNEKGEPTGHKIYDIRLGKDGKPYLPPTSIKGMLRSAYEAITNSRLSVLDKHDELLGYRMPANAGIQMVPARIENDHVCLYLGTSNISNDGRPQRGDPMYAAWLRQWNRNNTTVDRDAINYSGTEQLPRHGKQVRFWAEKFAKYKRNGTPIFTYWKVREVVPSDQQLGQPPAPTSSQGNGQHQPTDDPIRQFEGYVCITNKNITNKHDERIFFDDSNKVSILVSESEKKRLGERWKKLIESYQNNQEFNNGLSCPSALGNAAVWSRQITGGDREKELTEGTLCYAHVRKKGASFEIFDLYPVMISRSLYDQTPAEILNSTLKPATNKEKLSPADRVFGWVNQNGQGSYKGQLRVHSVDCSSDDAVDNFGSEEESFPLAILGQPKPEQARFYCADDEKGKPLHHGESDPKNKGKGEGYKYKDQNLRGRKVYPHHKDLPRDYWHNPLEDRTQEPDHTGHYQEYRQPQKQRMEQRSEQNRSIKGWVKPETEFQFEIDVINLSSVELGALLWLLASPDVYYHRLGGAKPLGFGSVWLDINWDNTDLRLGSEWAEFYQSLIPKPPKIGNGISCIDNFKKAVVSAYGVNKHFEQIEFISAFYNSSKGFNNAAIHYPRVTPHPKPEGEAFEWFVKNEQESKRAPGLNLSLPNLADSQPASFPTNPIQKKNNQH
ncbi:MAG: TIGR03986 family CRISPR-associated RAMP protein [Halothece sp. Uz-M2-17]|nr:TIGR03986 family CRISPR-associated RAMP protein [Halothece sp. Uz-M2-17]